ncbi:MAG: hypothetical protein RLZ28_79 [Actinomycetota bacterium]
MNTKPDEKRAEPVFSEKLLPSWSTFVWAAILFPSAYLVFLPISEIVGVILGITLTVVVWLAMIFASPKIIVVSKELRVGAAHIPVAFLSNCREIAPEYCFAERGPALDARAFVRFQIGVKPLVRLEINDPVDPTPYWLIATRKPAALIAAVTS